MLNKKIYQLTLEWDKKVKYQKYLKHENKKGINMDFEPCCSKTGIFISFFVEIAWIFSTGM